MPLPAAHAIIEISDHALDRAEERLFMERNEARRVLEEAVRKGIPFGVQSAHNDDYLLYSDEIVLSCRNVSRGTSGVTIVKTVMDRDMAIGHMERMTSRSSRTRGRGSINSGSVGGAW